MHGWVQGTRDEYANENDKREWEWQGERERERLNNCPVAAESESYKTQLKVIKIDCKKANSFFFYYLEKNQWTWLEMGKAKTSLKRGTRKVSLNFCIMLSFPFWRTLTYDKNNFCWRSALSGARLLSGLFRGYIYMYMYYMYGGGGCKQSFCLFP